MSEPTEQRLAEYRELVKFGSAIGIGGKCLAELLDHIDAIRARAEEAERLLNVAADLLCTDRQMGLDYIKRTASSAGAVHE